VPCASSLSYARCALQVVAPSASDKGDPFAFAGVYDGHGEDMQPQHVLAMLFQASLIANAVAIIACAVAHLQEK
jgi:hypothetical protein